MKRALCVGINDYPGSVNDLAGCINDADDWRKLLQASGFSKVRTILDESATVQAILSSLTEFVEESKAGDILVFTYSGHGTQVVDTDSDEADGYDEALYVYDGVLLDDDLRKVIKKLPPDVSLTIICDSCFSGTVTRAALKAVVKKRIPRFHSLGKVPSRMRRRKRFLEEEGMVEILLSGCSDQEYSYDAYFGGRPNGAFTYFAIKEFDKTLKYSQWYDNIRGKLPNNSYPQTPQLEGSKENKDSKVFTVLFAPDPDPIPVPEPPPQLTWWQRLLQWFQSFFR